MSNLNVVTSNPSTATSNPSTATSNPSVAASNINNANKSQSAQSLIIQTYANSVNEQPKVDFSGKTHLVDYEQRINDGLVTAQGHATNYLNQIQPDVIKNITSIDNYYALHNAVSDAMPKDATDEQWVQALGELKLYATQYHRDAVDIQTTLQGLSKDLSTDSQSFVKTVTELNTAVSGDNGVLASDNKELDSLQGQIDGAIAAIAISGITILAGGFVIAVGAISEFVTAGTSSVLVLGGVTMVLGGVAGDAAAAFSLKSLNDQKADLLREESALEEEVKLALGISSGYQSLVTQVNSAVTAATQMVNAWEFLSSDLNQMINDLQSGIISTGFIREIMLKATDSVIKTVLGDISTIKRQMAGVTIVVAKPGQTVGEAIVEAVKDLAA